MTTLIPKLTLAAGAVAIGLFASNAAQAGNLHSSFAFGQPPTQPFLRALCISSLPTNACSTEQHSFPIVLVAW